MGTDTGCGATDGGAPAYSTVSLFQEFFDFGGATVITSFASASFATTAPASSCTITAFGACSVVSCPANTDAGTGITLINGGTVTISTPTIATSPLVLEADSSGHYRSIDGGIAALPQQVFSGADPVSFDVAGAGNITALHADVAAPSFINVNDPTFPDGGSNVIVPIATDLTVTWDVVDTASACVNVNIDSPSGPALRCSFPASAGSGVVPHAALQALPVGAAAFDYGSFNQSLVEVPGFGGVLFQVFELQPSAGGTVLLQ